MSVLSVFIFLGVLFFVLSWGVHAYVNQKGEAGVDHWYWLCYRDALRKKKKFPPQLPNYLLDEDQAYPPVFPVLFSILPDAFFDTLRRWVPLGFNFLRLVLLMGTLYLLGVQDPAILLLCGIVYLSTPLIASYNTQLNPRGLGALLMDGLMVWMMVQTPDKPRFWVVAFVFMALILFTHKMTTQLLMFVLPVMALVLQRWELFGLIPATLLGVTVLSGGFYLRMLKAHKHIVWYWSRYWPLLGADPLKESPLYGEPGYKSPVRQFEPGWKNFVKRFLSIFLGNYAPVVLGALVLCFFLAPTTLPIRYLFIWLLASVLFAILTIMVPLLRGLGYGNLYLYNAAFPATVWMGLFALQYTTPTKIILAVVIGMNGVLLIRSLIQQRHHPGLILPKEVESAIAKTGEGSWLCIPMQWMEHLAYLCNKPVLWGGHAGSMEPLKQVFPVIQTPIPELKRKYALRYLLVDEAHLKDIQRIAIPYTARFSSNGLHILELS